MTGPQSWPRMPGTFIDAALKGEAVADDIDDWVGRWHEGAGVGWHLHEYLGMSWENYVRWTSDPQLLDKVIDFYREVYE